MKAKNILCTTALGLVFLTAAQAQTTIEITGATAFRKGTLAAIKQLYTNGGSFKYAHDQSSSGSFTSSTRAIFQGTVPGISGTTTIRTAFSGSVEGLRALALGGNFSEKYLDPAGSSFANASMSSSGTEVLSYNVQDSASSQAEFAFSDVDKAATPLASYNLPGDRVGVVAFTMITNEGAPANITNVTSKQFQALFSAGRVPAYVLTGVTTDNATMVYAVGRNDGSGTRTTYMAETGLGITTPVVQYATSGNYVTTTGNGSIQKIYKVPTGGNKPELLGSRSADASTVWQNNILGNGGYFSGGSLVTILGYTSSSTEVLEYDEEMNDGTVNILRAAGPIALVSFLSVSDAVTARNNGARFLSYNGVRLDGVAATGVSALTQDDKDKIRTGAYTAWSYQNLYSRTAFASNSNEGVLKTALIGALPAAITSEAVGLTMTEMNLASRAVDGGPVKP